MRGRKKLRSEMFEVTVFNNVHTCFQDVRDVDHRNAAPWVVGHFVKRKLADKTKSTWPIMLKRIWKIILGGNELREGLEMQGKSY